MRVLSIIILSLIGTVYASEPLYPLWDGHESVAEYAKKVNLPPTKALDLGSGVKLDLVLIPAATFYMGTPEYEKPWVGQTMVAVSSLVLFVVTLLLLVRSLKKPLPQFSLTFLVILMFVAIFALLNGMKLQEQLLLFIGVGVLFVALLLLVIRTLGKRKQVQFSLGSLMALTIVASFGVWGGVRWHKALNFMDDVENEHPIHEVTLTKPFYMGKYVVTQEQYQSVAGRKPSHFVGGLNPVEQVSWYDAQEFCSLVKPQYSEEIRLPTEAEWEFACRAGTNTKFYGGDNTSDLERIAWYSDNSKRTTHPVGQKSANDFGLFDMNGNVCQWCQDYYNTYSLYPAEDPFEPIRGRANYPVLRGGSWDYPSACCRSSYRMDASPEACSHNIGFRVIMSVSPDLKK